MIIFLAVSEDWIARSVTDGVVKAALTVDKGCQAELLSWTIENFSSELGGTSSGLKNIKVKYTLGGQHQEVAYITKYNPDRGKSHSEFYV